MLNFDIKVKGLDEVVKNFDKVNSDFKTELGQVTKKAGIMVQALMKKEAPVAKSQLRRTIEYKYKPISVSIYPTVNYAKFVEYGTKPHVILPKRAKALRFKTKGGKWVITRKVQHPGTKANAFVKRAYEKSIKPVTDLFQDLIDRILKTLAK
jgi:HK97 gp10 family phage protein